MQSIIIHNIIPIFVSYVFLYIIYKKLLNITNDTICAINKQEINIVNKTNNYCSDINNKIANDIDVMNNNIHSKKCHILTTKRSIITILNKRYDLYKNIIRLSTMPIICHKIDKDFITIINVNN